MAVFRTVSPVDGRVIVERTLASGQAISNAVDKSVKAGLLWRSMSLKDRIEILSKGLNQLVSNADSVAEDITRQMGRPIRFACGELNGVKERGCYMLGCAEESLADYFPDAKEGFRRYIRREPVGIVLVIAPWNYPYLTAINSIIPALVAGNTVLIKHSSQTPLCAERLCRAFNEAGLPEGVFQYLHLSHSDTEALIHAPEIGFVNFTGSVRGGKNIQQFIQGRFIDAGLELGGKDPAYVREDASLPYAIEQLVDGSYFNSGQSCCGIERIYVHRRIFDDFVDGFVALTRKYQLGNPLKPETTLGPMVKSSAADFVRGQIQEALNQGAIPLINESDFPVSEQGTAYLAPQVLINVSHDMRIMSEETFGPVVGIMPVNSDEQALALMNDSEFGLTASIWSADLNVAEQMGQRLQTGTVFMNRCDYLDPALVWTGVKNTGRGRSLSKYGYDAVTRLKSYHLKLEQG